MSAKDTIFALSSGQPPAAIAVLRISGDRAADVLRDLTRSLPKERRATLARVCDPDSGDLLDMALALWFPGPKTATGEDLVELHCHGGRAVVRAIEAVLAKQADLRKAEPGEFTRRAFANGRMDLAEAEGLSDLLFAETELQRRSAMQMAGGSLSRKVEDWQKTLLALSAQVEAELDFSDEDDVVPAQLEKIRQVAASLAEEFGKILDRPRTEKLRDGVRVVLGGPPNSGKSTLLNALVDREAAIVSDIAGTTRDVIEVPVALGGIPFLFVDTAGLRDRAGEQIEQIGMDRARMQFDQSDIILWLGEEGRGPDSRTLIELAARSDHPEHRQKSPQALSVSPVTGDGMDALVDLLIEKAENLLPTDRQLNVNERQAGHLDVVRQHLAQIATEADFLIIAEDLRLARQELDALTGRASTEHMLDSLFGNFCIGK